MNATTWDGPTDSDGRACRWLNKYECLDCDTTWEDTWSCQCDDDCPKCGTTMTPYDSDDQIDPSELVECQNCSWEGHIDDCKPIKDIHERVEPGETMPAGECPDCGALAHLASEYDKPETTPTNPELFTALADLLEWSSIMGGWDAPCWDRARALADRLRDAQAKEATNGGL